MISRVNCSISCWRNEHNLDRLVSSATVLAMAAMAWCHDLPRIKDIPIKQLSPNMVGQIEWRCAGTTYCEIQGRRPTRPGQA